MWRLVLDGKLDYNTVFYQMTPNQIDEANVALNRYIELSKPKKGG